jgi:hypothetical protein
MRKSWLPAAAAVLVAMAATGRVAATSSAKEAAAPGRENAEAL